MLILDASVVVKWFSEEEYTEKALEIRKKIRTGDERIVLPDLLLYELANALRYNPCFDAGDVRDAVNSIMDMGMDIITPTPEIINSAIALAFKYNTTVYDSFYLSLSKELGIPFITADRKLYEEVKELNLVKFIGDIV